MPRVLLVEDEPAIADTLVYALETECFEVFHALTGTDALAAAGRETFDFAILDIGLPDMTGLDVCRRLREISSIPVLFLTARNGEVDRILGLELGGDDYVTKPFSPREIVARVRAILRRSQTRPLYLRPARLPEIRRSSITTRPRCASTAMVKRSLSPRMNTSCCSCC